LGLAGSSTKSVAGPRLSFETHLLAGSFAWCSKTPCGEVISSRSGSEGVTSSVSIWVMLGMTFGMSNVVQLVPPSSERNTPKSVVAA
jgi:hypothetical protein